MKIWLTAAALVLARDTQGAAMQVARARGHAVMQTMLPNLAATMVGRPLVQAYNAHPIPVELVDFRETATRAGRTTMATYNSFDPTLRFNVYFLGLTPRELARLESDRPLREDVARRLEPLAIHELRHWANQLEHGSIALVENELDAFNSEAVHVMQRIAQDPIYLDRLPLFWSRLHANSLRKWIQGPRAALRYVQAGYGDLPSIHYPPTDLELERMTENARMKRRYGSVDGRGDVGRMSDLQVASVRMTYMFWSDAARVEANRDYFRKVWLQMQGHWQRWQAAHPNYRVPGPTPWGRGKMWLADIYAGLVGP